MSRLCSLGLRLSIQQQSYRRASNHLKFHRALGYTLPTAKYSQRSSGVHPKIDIDEANARLKRPVKPTQTYNGATMRETIHSVFAKAVADESWHANGAYRGSKSSPFSNFGMYLGTAVSAALVLFICQSWITKGVSQVLEPEEQPKKKSKKKKAKAEDNLPKDKNGTIIKSPYYVVSTDVKFSDVIGIGEERQELMDIVDFMKEPERYTSLGAKLPKGVLLSGPPGVGKTLLAKAVAGESGVPFFHIDGSSIDGPYVGQGTQKIKEIFTHAKKHAPSIIFIDEIDSVGGKRTVSDKYPHARHTINTLLSEMDGFDKDTPVVVLASTNMPDVLDEALTRAGRLDIKIHVGPPLRQARFDILQHYLAKLQTTVDVDVDEVARITGGMVPADFKNLANTAGRIAVQRNHVAVTQTDITEAHDEITMGIGLKAKAGRLSKECLENTAWHEAGHALCTYFMQLESKRQSKNIDPFAPVHKITIIPRGQSGGHTAFLTNDGGAFEDDLFMRLCVAYGGYVGEEMYHGEGRISTGPGGDFQSATRLAQSLVINGLYQHDLGESSHRFLKKKYEDLSEEEKEVVDKDIVKLCTKAYEYCKKLLYRYQNSMKCISEALVKYEQITAEEMEAIILANDPEGGHHLRYEDNDEVNKRRIVKIKGIRLADIPENIKAQNKKHLGKE